MSAEAAVRRYYELVDAGDVDGVVGCFADDAVYHRPGYEPMAGRAALTAFYAGERVIADGQHELVEMVADGHRVAVHGRFVGTHKDGRAVQVGFADFWVLDEQDRAITRRSFFDTPAV
ncbi:ketosteroid isomerase [Janibacter sp. Soil728]|uniref:nuclear transport factor 2 family protein n=1 Tax=Janibacter sp. Soil728 TaxID=1736393 RepID=UPI0006F2EED8|nr:nuclear transport factor 2 family protein [Janibacter sp. Soil728]KRE35805.1 ketosteroid isomerase [Janibacter sp. Soil728]